MEKPQQQLPTVQADTDRLLKDLERLAVNIRPANSTSMECREPEMVIKGK